MAIKLTADAFSWHAGNNGEWLQFRSNDAHKVFNELVQDGTYDITITKHRERRSLDANAYAWVLIDKIAEKSGVSKSEVYRHTVREIGGNSDVVCMQEKAYETFRKHWELNGVGWQTVKMPSKLDGCVNAICYYGSSTYDTAQMHRLIELLIQDAKALGIETMTPQELEALDYGQ